MSLSVTLLTTHLLGVGILVGVVFASLYFSTKIQSIEQLRSFITLRRIGSVGATVAILAGVAMAWKWAGSFLQNPLFLTKLGLVLVDGVIAEFGILKVLKNALVKNDTTNIKNKLLPWAVISAVIVTAIIAISVYRSKSAG